MAKKLFKSLTLGVIVFSAAILVGYFAYTVTYHYQTQKLRDAMMPEDFVSAAPAYGEATPRVEGEALWVDYYLAKLENDNIAVYMVSKEDVSFLYTLDVYTGNFPAAELLRLKKGVILKNRQELASFEEDYTS